MENKNIVAALIKYLAIITYCCGVVLFFVGLSNDAVGQGFIAIIAAFISGSMLLGFSEIIRLLHEINGKSNKES